MGESREEDDGRKGGPGRKEGGRNLERKRGRGQSKGQLCQDEGSVRFVSEIIRAVYLDVMIDGHGWHRASVVVLGIVRIGLAKREETVEGESGSREKGREGKRRGGRRESGSGRGGEDRERRWKGRGRRSFVLPGLRPKAHKGT